MEAVGGLLTGLEGFTFGLLGLLGLPGLLGLLPLGFAGQMFIRSYDWIKVSVLPFLLVSRPPSKICAIAFAFLGQNLLCNSVLQVNCSPSKSHRNPAASHLLRADLQITAAN